MKRTITALLAVCISFAGLFAQDAIRKLVVKPVLTTRGDTPTDWGGLASKVQYDPRYEMTKVEGTDNLYSCTITLNKYFKTNKWASKWGETVGFLEDGVTPNEGWSNNHRFVAVYQDEYGDQENKSNPNAVGGAQEFLVDADGTV